MSAVPRRAWVGALVRSARPHQWTKNMLVFAGIIFAAETGDASRWRAAFTAFAAYCLASSAAYLFNDVRDRERDRAHPTKRSRPIAAGELSAGGALATSAILAAAAVALAALLGWPSVALLGAFAALQVAYTARLKHVALLDVFAIAALFIIRAAAGAVAVDVRLSPWLLVCTGSVALLLALGKRRAEFLAVEELSEARRPVLGTYSLGLLNELLTIVAATTISAYSIYSFTATKTTAMMLTTPFVAFGVFRYLFLIQRRDEGEEPDRILVTDAPILVTVLLWCVAATSILVLD